MNGPRVGAGGRRATLVVVLAVVVVLGVAVAPAAGQDSNDDTDGLVSGSVDASISTGIAVAEGALASLGPTSAWLADAVDPTESAPRPADVADDLQATVNDNNATLVENANAIADEKNWSVQNGTYVLKLTIFDSTDNGYDNATLYVVGEGDGENITDIRATQTWSGSVDRNDSLSAYRAKGVNGDLQEYIDEYAEQGKTPSDAYIARMVAKYGVTEIKVKQLL